MLRGFVCCNGLLGGWSSYALHFYAPIPNQSIVTASVPRGHLIQSCNIFVYDAVRSSVNGAEAVASERKAVPCAKHAIERDANWHTGIATNSNEAKVASRDSRSRLPLGV
jgi:hypothetical protein